MRLSCRLWATALLLPLVAGLAMPSTAAAENHVGGHFGVVFPLVTHVDGDTTDITDDFKVGFPVGITVKKSDRLAFDLEFVPVVDDNPIRVDLTVHPGVLYGVGHNFTLGLRAAFDVSGEAWGFTPLVAKGFPIPGKNASYFVELDFPIRVQDDPQGDTQTAFTLAFHTGIGF